MIRTHVGNVGAVVAAVTVVHMNDLVKQRSIRLMKTRCVKDE